jgi:hypothetical protein
MMFRRALLMTLALAVLACGAPPSFPTEPPTISLVKQKPEPPPPKGVSRFEMDGETRSRVIMFAAGGSGLVVIVIVLGLAIGARRIAAAGISAAFLGPAIALAIAARHFARVITGLAAARFDFAQLALAIWNANQPVLVSFYCGSVLLIVLALIVAFSKRNGESGSIVTASGLLLAMAGVVVSIVSFVSMNRLLLAVLDPDWTNPLRRSIRFTGLGAVSQAISSRLMLTLSAGAVTILLLIGTLILSFTLRPIRRRLLITLFALIVILSATVLERMWCEVLETTARTGRVPETLLTR